MCRCAVFRTIVFCGYALLATLSFSMGQSGSAQTSHDQKTAQTQKSISPRGVKGGGSSLSQEQWKDFQKQLAQVQEQWLNIQRQQLEVQKENLRVLKEQQRRQLGFWDRFWQVLPSAITALMALVVSLIALNFNHWSTRRTARQDHIRMLMDIDKELIGRPYLWTVYGQNPEPAEGMEEKLKQLLTETKNYRGLQEDALMYAFFNMFEAVFDFHRHLGFYGWRRIPRAVASKLMFWSDRRKSDQEHKESWDRFATDFFSEEEGRRSWKLFTRQRDLYTVTFQKWVEEFHKKPPTESNAPQPTKAPAPAGSPAVLEITPKPASVSGTEGTGNGPISPKPPTDRKPKA